MYFKRIHLLSQNKIYADTFDLVLPPATTVSLSDWFTFAGMRFFLNAYELQHHKQYEQALLEIKTKCGTIINYIFLQLILSLTSAY